MASRILHLPVTSPLSLRSTLALRVPISARRPLTTTTRLSAEGDLGNPQSVSNEQSGLKTSRATKGAKSQDTASVAEPVSDRSKIPGDRDEGTPTEEAMKRSPEESAEKKRESVERQGEKPLGAEDAQK